MSVDVGSAVGYLDLDINGFLSGLRTAQSEAKSSTAQIAEDLSSGLQTVGDSIAKFGTVMTVGITTPVVTAVTASVNEFAKLEQAVGGVETLFKGSARDVIENSESAYRRAGVSGVAYMEQVTSFSARLLQGLGGDTKEAARIADIAMVDMSDNANKFGTGIESIQNAYQGFAKANYTMLDNLKLGYGGTKEEMARLLADAEKISGIKYDMENFDDIIEAIHVIQEEMGVTGTTALEASTTISGSFGAAKAALSDFLAGLGSQDADMKQLTDNLVEAVKTAVGNIKEVLKTIWDNIPLEPWQKNVAAFVVAAGPALLVIGKMVSGIGSLISTISSIGGAVGKIKGAFTALGATATASGGTIGAAFTAALGPIVAVVAIIAVLAAAFKTLWENNEEFRDKMTAIWDGIKEKFQAFANSFVEKINELGFDFENFTEMLKALWEGFCNLLAPIFEGIWQQVSNILSGVLDVLLGVLDIFVGIFTGDWEQVWEGVKGIFVAVWEFIKNTFQNWANVFKGLADTILGWFGTTWDELWTNVKNFFVNTWNSIKDFFVNIATTISTAVSNFVTSVITFFQQLPTKIVEFITNAWNSVVEWATNMVNKAREMGQNFLNAVVEFFTDLPYKVGYFIGNTLTNIVIWVGEMVQKAKEMGTNFLNAVVEFFTQLPGKVLQFITSAFENVKKWATDMVAKAKELGQQFLDTIVSFFTQLPGKVLGFITSTFENVKTWATNMVNKAKEMATNFINNVVNTLTSLPGKVKGFLDSAIENVKTWVTQMAQKGKEAIESLINSVVEGAKAIPGKMADIGKSIVEGVWNGIKNAANWFTDQVSSFFSGIVDGVKGALGINSPSKVFAKEIGQWLPAGVAVGFQSAMPAATKDIEDSLNDGIDSIKPDDIDINARASVTGFATKFKDVYTDVVIWFESIEARINRSINRMTESLAQLLQVGQMIVNPDGSLGYIGYNGFGPRPRNNDPANPERNPNGPGGDTFNFYSPKPLSEIEAARQMKQAKRDLAEGF